MAEIKTSRKEHDVKGAVQAKPFQLCHMRQVESVFFLLPILFILRWQLGSPCLPMQGYVLKTPSG